MPLRLLNTKLTVPPLRRNWVPRSRLIDRLETGLERKLILVSAPAGYGKTTLLSEWHAASQGKDLAFAWMLLDEHDNDPVRFWRYLLAAVAKARPGVEEGAQALLHGLSPADTARDHTGGRWLQDVMAVLVNDLESETAGSRSLPHLLLVLDDYHTIHSPVIHDTVSLLLEYLPAAVHIVILTRADPPLPLARLRARDQLLDLRAADLRFSAGEANQFLKRVMDLDLSDEAIAALDSRTEGWAAGLQLAALSLQGLDHQQVQRFVVDFEGTHRHILSYLREEVLQRQSSELQDFLLQTSILPYLTPPLCDSVMGRPGSQAVLEQLVDGNLFTTSLDGRRQWYRYHPLFRDALLTRLEQSSPDLPALLHRRASKWYQEQGVLAEAIRHALAAGDPLLAGELVESGYKRLVMRGELVTLHHWLDALPAELVRSRPRLCLAHALALAYSGRRELADRWLAQAEAVLADRDGTPDVDAVQGEIIALRAVFSSVNWAGQCSLELSRQALELLPMTNTDEDLWLRVLTIQALGNCHRFQGELRQAEESYLEALSAARALDSPFLIQAISNRLGQTYLLRGRLRQAAQTFEVVLQQAEDLGGELNSFSAELHAHLGRIFTEWGALDAALQQVDQAIRLGRQAENRLALWEGYMALADVRSARGEEQAARAALDQAQQLAIEANVPYLSRQVAAQRIRFGLACGGDGTSGERARKWAKAWAAQRLEGPDDELPIVLREYLDLTLAQVWLCEGWLERALTLVNEISAAAQQAGRMDRVIKALVLRARIQWEQGQRVSATDTMEQALALAEPEGYRRIFLEEGDSILELLTELRSSAGGMRATLVYYVDHLLAASSIAQGLQTETRDKALVAVDPLTTREMEILRLMADGASNRRIAEQLVITEGTVKGHVNHILDKLAAHNRTEAVARARTLGLLRS